MPLFGALHVSLLLVIAALAFVLVTLSRKGILRARIVCNSVGAVLIVNELIWGTWRYSREGIHAGNLPLELCDVAVWVAAFASITRSQVLAEFTWFAGLGGAGMALLTPDLLTPWPSWPDAYFFIAHGAIIVAALLLAFSGVIRFEPRSPLRAFAMLLGWSAIAGSADALLNADYMFLREKPPQPSLLDWLGPWPWYIAGAAGVALALFWLLWIPVRPSRARNKAGL